MGAIAVTDHDLFQPFSSHRRFPKVYRYGEQQAIQVLHQLNSQSSQSNASSASTFEEVESLDLERSFSSDSSMRTGMHTSSASRSTDTSYDQPANQKGPVSRPGSAFSDYVTSRAKGIKRRQLSLDRTSMTSSNAGGSTKSSTFEEVESLDLDGQLEVNLNPYFLRSQGQESQARLRDGIRHVRRRASPRSSRRFYGSLEDLRRRQEELALMQEESDNQYPPVLRGKRGDAQVLNGGAHGSAQSTENRDHARQKTIIDQLLQYKQQQNLSDSQSSTSSVYAASTTTGSSEPVGQLPFETEYEYYVRRHKLGHLTRFSHPTGVTGSRSGPPTRTASIDSSSSSFSSSSSPDAYSGLYINSPAPAEEVLLNLGFCTADSFLPERFARDWFSKIMNARTERMQQQRQEMEDVRGLNGPGVPNQERRSSASDLVYQLDANSREFLSSRPSRLQRAATIITYHQEGPRTPYNVGPELQKEDSIEQLKYVLERQRSMLQQTDVARDRRQAQFALGRQQSLPLYLETLSEEDESRRDSLEKHKHKSFSEGNEKHSGTTNNESSEPQAKKGSDSDIHSYSSGSLELQRIASQSNNASITDSDGPYLTSTSSNTSESEGQMEVLSELLSQRTNRSRNIKEIPAIVVSTNKTLHPQSSASIELEEIMDNTSHGYQTGLQARRNMNKNKNLLLPPEPAMMSSVLSDLEDSGSESTKSNSLLSPSTSSNLLSAQFPRFSMSPAPLSPITVIEAEHLDNQNDNIDLVDVAFESEGHEGHDIIIISDESDPLQESGEALGLQPISEEESLISSADQSWNNSFEDQQTDLSNRMSRNHFSPIQHDLGVEASDGRVSPLVMFKRLSDNEDECEDEDNSEILDKEQEIVYLNAASNSVDDRCFQADDGTLSPIMFSYNRDEDITRESDFVFVSDISTQCEPVPSVEHRGIQTEQLNNLNLKHSETQTYDNFLKLNSLSDGFDPTYVCNVGSQTDAPTSTTEKNPVILTQCNPSNVYICHSCQKVSPKPAEQECPAEKVSELNLSNSVESTEAESYTTSESIHNSPGRRMLDATIDRLRKKTKHIRRRYVSGIDSLSFDQKSINFNNILDDSDCKENKEPSQVSPKEAAMTKQSTDRKYDTKTMTLSKTALLEDIEVKHGSKPNTINQRDVPASRQIPTKHKSLEESSLSVQKHRFPRRFSETGTSNAVTFMFSPFMEHKKNNNSRRNSGSTARSSRQSSLQRQTTIYPELQEPPDVANLQDVAEADDIPLESSLENSSSSFKTCLNGAISPALMQVDPQEGADQPSPSTKLPEQLESSPKDTAQIDTCPTVDNDAKADVSMATSQTTRKEESARILHQIALDYAMMKAVNETFDFVFPPSSLQLGSTSFQGTLKCCPL